MLLSGRRWRCTEPVAERHSTVPCSTRTTICWVGGWAKGSDVPERHYIDPTFMPSPACYMLYGWLLSHQFQVDAGVCECARVLPDPLDEQLPPS